MLDRANDPAASPQADADTKPRPVEFRGAGFVPRAGRYSGWIALCWRSDFGNWPAAPLSSIRCFCRRHPRSRSRSTSSRSAARFGIICRFRSCASERAGFSARSPASSSASAIGLSSLARGVGITFISALFPIPKIALLPLLILWLGIGEEPKIATIALGVFFSTAISVYSGVDNVPRNLIRMAQSFNVPFHSIVRRVIWPGALPSILAGFRITASVALLLVVSAEMIGAEYGIGAFVLQAGNLMQTDQLLAGVVILSLFGLAVGKLINLLETRLLHWR